MNPRIANVSFLANIAQWISGFLPTRDPLHNEMKR
jgi:hypothetical protein